jgi:hypothetical protein
MGLATRVTSTGSNVDTILAESSTTGTTNAFVATANTEYLRVTANTKSTFIIGEYDSIKVLPFWNDYRINNIPEDIQKSVFPMTVLGNAYGYGQDITNWRDFEDHGIDDVTGANNDSAQSVFRTIGYIPENTEMIKYRLPFSVFRYNASDDSFDSIVATGVYTYIVPKDSAYKYRINASKTEYGGNYLNDVPYIHFFSNEDYTSDYYVNVIRPANLTTGICKASPSMITEGFGYDTTYSEYVTALDNLILLSKNYITKEVIGQDSGGNDVYGLTLVSPKYYNMCKPGTTPKVLLMAGQQGSEKASIFGLYYFMKQLSLNYMDNPLLEFLHSHVIIKIIPIICPWGFDHKTYYNANEVSINRNYYFDGWTEKNQGHPSDYTGPYAFSEPESQNVKNFVEANMDGLLYIDFHTSSANDPARALDYMSWFSMVSIKDEYFQRVYLAIQDYIMNWTPFLLSDYNVGDGINVAARVTIQGTDYSTNYNGNFERWASTIKKKIAFTLEGVAGLYGSGETFTSESHRCNCDIITNVVLQILRQYLS